MRDWNQNSIRPSGAPEQSLTMHFWAEFVLR